MASTYMKGQTSGRGRQVSAGRFIGEPVQLSAGCSSLCMQSTLHGKELAVNCAQHARVTHP